MFWAGKFMSKLANLPEGIKKADRDLKRIQDPGIDKQFDPSTILKECNEEITEKRVKIMNELFETTPIRTRRTKKATIFDSKSNTNWGNAVSRSELHPQKIAMMRSTITGKVIKTLWLIWVDLEE